MTIIIWGRKISEDWPLSGTPVNTVGNDYLTYMKLFLILIFTDHT